MTSADPLFIDTNILIYANVATAPFHEQSLIVIEKARQAGRPLWISRQVLREFIAARTRPQTFARPSTPEVVIQRVRYLEGHFQVADDTAAVTGRLAGLMRDFRIGGRQVHDANIVATMLAHGIPALLTHNTKDFERFCKVVRIEGIDSD
ncbi:MAG: Predicted nucleic acid-binding protein, contains PIN domain [Candidatus Kentron sp. G]|nr:MAG: Predicted nucleic acid-binding protein, contains PIN domain [Candidatus Kentron sp. G]VFM95989.1 MAG: Predicted nucleic acid-binding protein, contains PIN domain [Candidatus Kentron sp. G]VFM97824.1 MAG: Predicted nucleic acid-binding protein, contains PIN domain [Candidatus Kentron sp. G]